MTANSLQNGGHNLLLQYFKTRAYMVYVLLISEYKANKFYLPTVYTVDHVLVN